MADEETKNTRPEERSSYTRQGLEEAGTGFLHALGDGIGQLFDRGRIEVEQVARTGKANYDRYQAERERDVLYRQLGRAVVHEIADGRLDLPGFEDLLQRIAEAEERVAEFAAEPTPESETI